MEELGLCFDTWGSICSYKRKNTSCYFNRFAPPLRFFVMPPKPLNPFFAKCRVFAPLTVSWSQVLLQSYVCVHLWGKTFLHGFWETALFWYPLTLPSTADLHTRYFEKDFFHLVCETPSVLGGDTEKQQFILLAPDKLHERVSILCYIS